jgi:UDP-N-acetyl-L-fucosamine synthase
MQINPLKIITILGTRPEIIRLSCVMKLLDKYFNHIIAHTGQNYDHELNEIFFEDLELRKPDVFFNTNTSSLGTTLGDILVKSEELFNKENPDAVLILGDTNSALSGIMAKRLKIPLYHMEAGNRCFDQNVPEEINRKIIDHISDFNLVYTEHARRHLLAEGLPQRRIYLTGSPMKEVLMSHLGKIKASKILSELNLEPKKFFLVSAHREENVDNEENLIAIINALELLEKKYNFPILVSTHPRTRNRLDKLGKTNISPNINFLKPFGFIDYNHLQLNAFCTLSDSGTISEESAILQFPAVTIRNATERPESLDSGNIILAGLDPSTIINAINLVINEEIPKLIPNEYNVDNVSDRVAKIILGTAKLSNKWNGIVKNDLT